MNRDIWEKCTEFHGHECGGLTIGYKAALYAIELLGLEKDSKEKRFCIAADEELVCIAENDACGIDAIQVILGCSVGKGNLLFRLTGKQAFSFYSRKTGRSFRLVLKPGKKNMTREEAFVYYQGLQPEEMFEVKKTKIPLPEKARMFQNVVCSCCKETVAENKVRLWDGKAYCLDCYEDYNRFQV